MDKFSVSVDFRTPSSSRSLPLGRRYVNPDAFLDRMDRLNARRADGRSGAINSAPQHPDAALLRECEALDSAWRYEVAEGSLNIYRGRRCNACGHAEGEHPRGPLGHARARGWYTYDYCGAVSSSRCQDELHAWDIYSVVEPGEVCRAPKSRKRLGGLPFGVPLKSLSALT